MQSEQSPLLSLACARLFSTSKSRYKRPISCFVTIMLSFPLEDVTLGPPCPKVRAFPVTTGSSKSKAVHPRKALCYLGGGGSLVLPCADGLTRGRVGGGGGLWAFCEPSSSVQRGQCLVLSASCCPGHSKGNPQASQAPDLGEGREWPGRE